MMKKTILKLLTDLKQRTIIFLPDSFLTAVCLGVYLIAYVLTPYWNLYNSTSSQLFTLLFILMTGISWSWLSASSFKISLDKKHLLLFLAIFLIAFIMNYQALISDIPWRGDESFHIEKVFSISTQVLSMKKWFLSVTLLFLSFLVLAWKKPRWAEFTGAILILVIVFMYKEIDILQWGDTSFLIRYPFVNYWFSAVIPTLTSLFINPFHEFLYRLIPFFCAVALAWYFQTRFSLQNGLTRVLLGISVLSLPLVFYYATIFYLELPAVFLMSVVCFQIKDLVYQDSVQVRQRSGWYALIFIGFIKETTVPFLVCFLFVRWIIQYLRCNNIVLLATDQDDDTLGKKCRSWIRLFTAELSIAFSVLFPALLYFSLRTVFGTNRSFGMHLQSMFEPSAYTAIMQSFTDQFGIFLLFFLAGCFILFRKKEYATAGFLLSVVLGYQVFYIVDNWRLVGYSRFNLLVLPTILAGAAVFINWVMSQKKSIGVALIGLAILVNFVISPINLDGSKKPYWGNYNVDTSEHYYPYREAIAWLGETYPGVHSLSGGLYYPYPFDFYSDQFHWKPQDILFRSKSQVSGDSDSAELAIVLAEAKIRNDPIVLFHVLGKKFLKCRHRRIIAWKKSSATMHTCWLFIAWIFHRPMFKETSRKQILDQ